MIKHKTTSKHFNLHTVHNLNSCFHTFPEQHHCSLFLCTYGFACVCVCLNTSFQLCVFTSDNNFVGFFNYKSINMVVFMGSGIFMNFWNSIFYFHMKSSRFKKKLFGSLLLFSCDGIKVVKIRKLSITNGEHWSGMNMYPIFNFFDYILSKYFDESLNYNHIKKLKLPIWFFALVGVFVILAGLWIILFTHGVKHIIYGCDVCGRNSSKRTENSFAKTTSTHSHLPDTNVSSESSSSFFIHIKPRRSTRWRMSTWTKHSHHSTIKYHWRTNVTVFFSK